MIQNIIIGLIYASFGFLLASANAATQPYAIFAALALLILGFLLAYYKQKKGTEARLLQNQHLESINKALAGLHTKSDFEEYQAKLSNLLVDFKEKTLQHQQSTSNELNLKLKGFEEALTLFQESIAKYDCLVQEVRDNMADISKRTEVVPARIEESFNKTMTSMAKSVNDSFNNIDNRTAEALEKQTLMTERYISRTESTIKNAIANLAKTMTANNENFSRSLTEGNKEIIRKQGETFMQMLTDNTGKMKQSMADIKKSTSEMTETIADTLDRIDDSTTDNLKKMNSEFTNALEDMTLEISNTLATLTDQLTSIAAKCTDYQKEKDIVNQLERLCRK